MIIEYQVLTSPSFRYPGIYGQKCKIQKKKEKKCKIHLSAEGRAAKLEKWCSKKLLHVVRNLLRAKNHSR